MNAQLQCMWAQLVLLASLPLAAIACIPTKHPEPGIPATPGPVNTGCTQFGAATVADCNRVTILDGSPQPGSCAANTALTPMSITCAPGQVIFLYSSTTQNLLLVNTATCDATTKQWTFVDTQGGAHTQAQAEGSVGNPLTVACTNPY